MSEEVRNWGRGGRGETGQHLHLVGVAMFLHKIKNGGGYKARGAPRRRGGRRSQFVDKTQGGKSQLKQESARLSFQRIKKELEKKRKGLEEKEGRETARTRSKWQNHGRVWGGGLGVEWFQSRGKKGRRRKRESAPKAEIPADGGVRKESTSNSYKVNKNGKNRGRTER